MTAQEELVGSRGSMKEFNSTPGEKTKRSTLPLTQASTNQVEHQEQYQDDDQSKMESRKQSIYSALSHSHNDQPYEDNQLPPSVPHAINSGSKYMVFRPLKNVQLWRDPKEPDQMQIQKHIDKGYYYKFNCQMEIRMVKLTFEDNGFLP